MPETQPQTPAQKMIGDFAPKLVSLTDDVLFGDVWERTELSKRDRNLITVADAARSGAGLSHPQQWATERSGSRGTTSTSASNTFNAAVVDLKTSS
jgi:hypothetical protein